MRSDAEAGSEEISKKDKKIAELEGQLAIKETNEKITKGIFAMYYAIFSSKMRLGENYLLSKAFVDNTKRLFTYSLGRIKWKEGDPKLFALGATQSLYEDNADLVRWWKDPIAQAPYFRASHTSIRPVSPQSVLKDSRLKPLNPAGRSPVSDFEDC